MKYVATKSGEIFTFYDNANYMQYINVKENFLKEANSIEELCDEFVVIGTKDNYIARTVYNSFDKELFIDLKCKANGFEIYGAIWTDKGLIYIAKMNSEGELELI